MAAFFQSNADFLIFLHGIVVFLIALQLWLHAREDKEGRWLAFALYALGQGILIVFDLLAGAGIHLGVSPWLESLLLLLSLLCLGEFAWSDFKPPGVRRLGVWMYPLPFVVSLLAFEYFPGREVQSLIYQAAGLPVLVWAVVVLWRRSVKPSASAHARGLRWIAVALAAHGLACLLRRPEGGFLFEAVEWRGVSGAEVDARLELAALLGSLFLLASVCLLSALHRRHQMPVQDLHGWLRRRYAWTLLGVLVMGLGWGWAEYVGAREDSMMRAGILMRTQVAAAAVPRELAGELKWGPEDLGTPAYAQLKQLLRNVAKANEDLRFAMLMGMKDRQVYFLADSELPTSPDYSPPGQRYEEAEADYIEAVGKGIPFVQGPIVDRWGTWVSGSVPVLQTPRGRVTLDFDVAAPNWRMLICQARLSVFLITLLISSLLVGSLLTQEKIRDGATKVMQAESQSRSLVEGSPNCVQMFDAAGCFVVVNSNGLRSLAMGLDQLAGRSFVSIWPEASRPVVDKAVQRVLAGERVNFEADYGRPDGEQISWHVTLTPLEKDGLSAGGFVGISVDITERKRTERALLFAKEAAEAATRAKSEFLAVMSHEIRTPLSGVIGLMGLLRKTPLNSRQKHYTELAKDSAEVLLHILDDILDTAKIESGKLTLESVAFRPRKDFMRLVEVMQSKALAKGLELSCEIAESVPKVLVGDPVRLRQALANLVSNAVKFTRHGSVQVFVSSKRGCGEGDIILCIEVKDTGIGIPAEAQERIFRRFEQADSTTTREFGGTGLGLAIVSSLAVLMGGDLRVRSAPGQGASFFFSAHVRAGDLSMITDEGTGEGSGGVTLQSSQSLNLLCAEDNPTNQVIIESLLRGMGHKVEIAENGLRALELLRDNVYDGVIMDGRMPVMDGFEATKILRQFGAEKAGLYVLALTANTAVDYRVRCLDSGMNDYLSKPVSEESLHAALERMIVHVRKHGAVPGGGGDRPASPGGFSPPGLSVEELLSMVEEEVEEQSLRKRPSIPEELMPTVRMQYLRDAPERVKEMRTSLEIGDLDALGLAAHSMKSISHYVDADDLAQVCGEIEQLVDSRQLDPVPALIQTAEAKLVVLVEKLKKEGSG